MQRLRGLAGKVPVDGNQVVRPRHFAGNDDLVGPETGLEREFRRLERGHHHALVDDLLGGETEVPVGVLLHLAHDEVLVERPAIDADAHRLPVADRGPADRRELLVTPLAGPDVPWVDPVLVESLGALRVLRQEDVAVVMEIADERGRASREQEPALQGRHGLRRFRQVHRHAKQLGSGLPQFQALLQGRVDIRRVGVAHRLHDDGRAASDADSADVHANRLVTRCRCHEVHRSLPVRRLMAILSPGLWLRDWGLGIGDWRHERGRAGACPTATRQRAGICRRNR